MINDHDWARVISVAVVPVVIISACALMCLAFYNRLAAVVSRLRAFQRERLAEQERFGKNEPNADYVVRRRQAIDTLLREQTDRVIGRARLLRATLLCLLSAIGSLVGCSILIGSSVMWSPAIYPAVGLFLAGMTLMLGAVLCAIAEMRQALDPVELEMEVVARLGMEPADSNSTSSDAA